MDLTMRRYGGEEDFWRVRSFLRQVFLENGRREVSWQVARFDYWRWHGIENCGSYPAIDDVVFLWEREDGTIGAVLNPEGKGEVFLQVHPGARSAELEEEMLRVGEERLAAELEGGRKKMRVFVRRGDALRERVLEKRGYRKGARRDSVRYRDLTGPLPQCPPPEGYLLRALGDLDELPARSWASWRAFHPGEPNERYEGWEWYQNIQRMPLYRRDLDVVAVAPRGEIAAFCTVWYDDVTRTGYFEPVGRVPEHAVRRLARSLLCEGLRRLGRVGATLATVGGGSFEANVLYASVFSMDAEVYQSWEKEWSPPDHVRSHRPGREARQGRGTS